MRQIVVILISLTTYISCSQLYLKTGRSDCELGWHQWSNVSWHYGLHSRNHK